MSRFARLYEDPEYDTEFNNDDKHSEQDILEWLHIEIDGVAEKPQEPYSPFETINS